MRLGLWPINRIILSSARVCRIGEWFGFVRSALLLAVVGTCVVLSFEAMPGLCCLLRVTHGVDIGVCILWRGQQRSVLLQQKHVELRNLEHWC